MQYQFVQSSSHSGGISLFCKEVLFSYVPFWMLAFFLLNPTSTEQCDVVELSEHTHIR